jgi:hypothetical protein
MLVEQHAITLTLTYQIIMQGQGKDTQVRNSE